MNINVILKQIAASLARAQAFAGLHRTVLVLAAEFVGALLILWGLIHHPRTCIAIAVATYLLYRYGPERVHAKGE
ncbi:hypothetical protein V5E97_10295 [Singulisphaera sp. Ch08]|uniref:DoxX family membrane protein n=1 Tax=Singulisphaera sp. Ch08 TaxID=3120278 RepID=A0AAU7CM61_9BACT